MYKYILAIQQQRQYIYYSRRGTFDSGGSSQSVWEVRVKRPYTGFSSGRARRGTNFTIIIQKELWFVRLRSWLNRNSPCLLPDESLGHSTTQLYQSLETPSSILELFALFAHLFFLFFTFSRLSTSLLHNCTHQIYIYSTWHRQRSLLECVRAAISDARIQDGITRLFVRACTTRYLPSIMKVKRHTADQAQSFVLLFTRSPLSLSLSLYRTSQPKRRPRWTQTIGAHARASRTQPTRCLNADSL